MRPSILNTVCILDMNGWLHPYYSLLFLSTALFEYIRLGLTPYNDN